MKETIFAEKDTPQAYKETYFRYFAKKITLRMPKANFCHFC